MLKISLVNLIVIFCAQFCFGAGIGKVVIIKGDAGLVHEKSRSKIKIGNTISSGDEIVTEAGAYVKVVMADRNILVVAENTKLIIDEYVTAKDKKSVQMTMDYGSARHILKQKYVNKNEKYEVRTATAVAGVRGTDFFTIYDGKSGDAVVCTLKGKVSLEIMNNGAAAQSPVMVEAGHFIKVRKGELQPKINTTDKLWLKKHLKIFSL